MQNCFEIPNVSKYIDRFVVIINTGRIDGYTLTMDFLHIPEHLLVRKINQYIGTKLVPRALNLGDKCVFNGFSMVFALFFTLFELLSVIKSMRG